MREDIRMKVLDLLKTYPDNMLSQTACSVVK